MVGVGRALCGSPSPTPCPSRVTQSRLHSTASRRVSSRTENDARNRKHSQGEHGGSKLCFKKRSLFPPRSREQRGCQEAKASRRSPRCARKAPQLPLALREAQHQHLSHKVQQSESTLKPIYDLSKNIAKEPYGREVNILL